MANYLEEYAEYFKDFQEFVAKLNYEDDLLPSNLKCRTGQEELVGECVEWTLRYLRLTKCPQSLLSFLTKTALDRVKLKNDEYTQEGVLAPNMVEIVNEVCLQYCGNDNPALSTLPAPPSVPTPIVSTCAIKNSRRRMENRHAIVEDLDVIFNISTSRPTNYYAIFDGHSGVDAATYCSTHMHCFIAQSPKYPSDPEGAMKDAFARTESLFTEKCNQENINGGCTALCVLHRPLDRQIYAAWAGDSQAIVVSQNKILRLINPHKPERKDEQKRIEQAGGVVLFYGTWRVNGQLAVSRAIGDVKHKQFVSGVPEITSVTLDGDEDFLVLGCDGLWDSVKEIEVASTLYEQLQNEPGDDASGFSQSVVSLARRAGSRDNISVLVVLLRPVGRIAQGANESANLANKQPEVVAAYGRPDGAHMDILDSVDNANNPFLNPTNGLRDDGGLMFDSSPSEEEQGVRLQNKEAADDDEEDDEDDMGPETDVDAVDDDDVDDVDDVLVSPTSNDAVSNPFLEKTSLDKNEVLALALGKGLPDADLGHDWLGQPAGAEGADDDQPTSLEPLEPLTSSQLAKGGAEDNVGESGEESEDEWNYYRVEPTGDKESGQQNPDSGDSEEMESQLNPNAAVFIPSSPTENSNHIEQPFNENLTQEEFFNKDNVMSSSFIAHDPVSAIESSPVEDLNGKDEVWLSSSPKKGGVPLDNVNVPPEDEFDREVSQRPGDLDVEHSLNGTGGSDSVFESKGTDSIIESLENSKNIMEDDVCGIENGIQESVTNIESLNPFNVSKSQDICSDIGTLCEFTVSENENALDEFCGASPISNPVETVESKLASESMKVEEVIPSASSKVEELIDSECTAVEELIASGSTKVEELIAPESTKELIDEIGFNEVGTTGPLEPTNPLEPTSTLQHDISTLWKPVTSENFSTDPVVESDQAKPESILNLDADVEGHEEIISSIDAQSADLEKIVNPIHVQSEDVEEIKESIPVESQLDHEKISSADDKDEFKITEQIKDKNPFEFDQPAVIVHAEPQYEQFKLHESNETELLNDVDVSNGNLHVYKPSADDLMQSPIVSGSSDFAREHVPEKNSFLAPSFGHGLSTIDTSAEPLNEAVLYSNSGFDTMMEAPSNVVPSSPSHISAQSTPFEGDAFEFEPMVEAVNQQESVPDSVKQEKLDAFSQSAAAEINSQFLPQDDVNDRTNDLNEGFAEDSQQFAPKDDIVVIESSPAKPDVVDLTVEEPPVMPATELTGPDVFPEENAFDDSILSANNSALDETLDSKPVGMELNACVPDVTEHHMQETAPLSSENDTVSAPIHPVTQDLVNGIYETAAVVPLSVSEPIVEAVLATESNSVPEIPVVDLDVSEEVQVGLENIPESDSLNKSAAIAATAVGAATIAAVAGVAAVSKTDKKTTSKAPITKAKPAPATKAPIKATTSRPSTTTSATAPKKSAVPPVPAARAAPKTATAPKTSAPKTTAAPRTTAAAAPRTTAAAPRTTAAPKPKPVEAASKAPPTAKPAPPKPRITPSPRPLAEKKPLTNGDASKPAAAKALTKPPTRPATAPARTSSKPTASSTVSTTVSKTSASTTSTTTARTVPARKTPLTTAAPKPKPASTVSEAKLKPSTATGVAARPRPATATSTNTAKSSLLSAKAPPTKPIDKQTKESTNKLISATRTTVSRNTANKTTVSKTATAVTAAAKAIASKPQPIRKPTTATTNGSTKEAEEKKNSENIKEPITNGVIKNGHATPEEIPVQNGVSHEEPVF